MARLSMAVPRRVAWCSVVEPVPARYAALVKAAYQGYNQAIVDGIVKARAGG